MKFYIENSVVKEYLSISEQFDNIDDFCDYLWLMENVPNIKPMLRKMLAENVLKDDKKEKSASQKRLFKENIEWMRSNCYMGEEDLKEKVDTTPFISEKPQEKLPKSSFSEIKELFQKEECNKVKTLEADEIDYSDVILREGGIITQQSGVQLYITDSGINLDTSKILVIEETGNSVLAAGHLVQENSTTYSVVLNDAKYIDYKGFKNVRNARFVLYDKNGEIYCRKFEMSFEPFNIEDKRPLCIDFGTSNTTVGSYGILNKKEDKAEICKFIDVTVTPNNTESILLPTVIYVEDCSNPDDIKYLFGYEARKKIEEDHYESNASVFYEIKRWMSSADEEEIIRDNNNNTASPTRKTIIKAYIDYVIACAEQYFSTRFERLHFSAPVKQKEQFINVFSSLYDGEKDVLSAEESIDEGIAIVYNQIITLMYAEKQSKEDSKQPKTIMIMDCGGGTTDLASCEYKYQETNKGTVLELETCFENGNPNFGGNNITYRIMQLLKIKIAACLKGEQMKTDGDAISLIDKSENEILGIVESHMNGQAYDSDNAYDDIYSTFLAVYERAEQVIPTRFVDNSKYKGKEVLKRIKRNFYYLWRQAEQIKIEFYKTERVLMDFDDIDENTIINIKNQDNYYLYIVDDENNNSLKRIAKPFEKTSITIKEINRVICGDIYSLLVGLFQDGELSSKKIRVDDFNYYKLSGQSCKISLFSELLKEYIPGRNFRPRFEKSGAVEKRKSEDLKLDCILGCINYVKDQRRNEIEILPKSIYPEIIYNVRLQGGHNNDKDLFECKDINDIHIDVSSETTSEYPLVVTGKDDVVERKFIFELANENDFCENPKSVNTEEIKAKLKEKSVVNDEGLNEFVSKLSDEMSKCKDNEKVNVVFIVPAKLGYGFYIGQIQAHKNGDGTEYKFFQFEYYNFEDSSKTFFDGQR